MARALFVQPRFSDHGFWNYRSVCSIAGAKYPSPPLGLVTVAALFPPAWELRLVDVNAEPLTDAHIEWADVVCTGGMLPQQTGLLRVIDRVHRHGKPVLVGGADPTSQPAVYDSADFVVLGEAESVIGQFVEDFENGATSGRYRCLERPAMAESPIPRYELLDFNHYLMVGVQFSRGCPFSCEFCDIIELFGRVPRTKSAEQVVAELDYLYRLGYRGHIDFVDDNFIGHKQKAKDLLRAVRRWWLQNGRPFYFSTEASVNLADDSELLSLMRDLDFRYVFVGIETPDEELLRAANKGQNLRRRLVDSLDTIYRHGIIVNAGFIVGFDGESDESVERIHDIIRDGCIPMAMVGLLYALPNTQLSRRLSAEGRLFDTDSILSGDEHEVDQTTAGLNFETQRPRRDIFDQYVGLVRRSYTARSYFARVRALARRLRPNYRSSVLSKGLAPALRSLVRLLRAFAASGEQSWLFIRTLIAIALTNPAALEAAINLMAMYLHFARHVRYLDYVHSRPAANDTAAHDDARFRPARA